ncbi:Cysteine-rich repeat secretory protein 3 [Quillaja saponaria]|uniref:Cysteine-rich repeat secretory protein 3 n=1 Tax=Quillaja saponaria TaxID=32244 RepID=A0AAD7VE91_QUISA|nr:Cysteine-rich repeat secretory protein 3 [Quillaja saponaria]
MGIHTKPFTLLSLSLIVFSVSGFFHFFLYATTAADTTNLVYKGCAAQKFQDTPEIYSQNLKTLFASLVSQSGQKGFSSATSGQGQNGIMGLYQCRGDLTNSECYNRVSKIPAMVDKLCGKSIAARIQLNGCYLRCEIIGFKQVSGTELLYKVCGKTQARSYESLYVLGQCEADLAANDCGDCVNTAEERAKAECGDSISAQVYLHKCYISYSYYPNGVTSISSTSSGSKQHTEKIVAVAVGGFATLGFVIVCLLFLRSLMTKKGGKH